MATHSSVLAWRIPGMGEPGGLLSMGSHSVGQRLKWLSSSRGDRENVEKKQPLRIDAISVQGDGRRAFRPLLLFSYSLCHVWLFVTPWTAAHQASSPSPSPSVCSNPCSLSQRCHPTISSSVIPLSPFPQSIPASRSFPMSPPFASGGQSIGASASASALPVNIQDWFPLGLTGLISLQSKGLSRVFYNTTVQRHRFFNTQSVLFMIQPPHPYMTTGKTIALTIWTLVGKVMSLLFNIYIV